MNKLLNEKLILNEEAKSDILKKSSVLDCECPKHLINILNYETVQKSSHCFY